MKKTFVACLLALVVLTGAVAVYETVFATNSEETYVDDDHGGPVLNFFRHKKENRQQRRQQRHQKMKIIITPDGYQYIYEDQ